MKIKTSWFRNNNFQKHFEDFFFSEMEYRFKEAGMLPQGGQYSGKPSMGGLINSVFHTLVGLSSKKMPKSDFNDMICVSLSSGLSENVSLELFGRTNLPQDNGQLFNFTYDYYKPAVAVFSGLEFEEIDTGELFNHLITIRDTPLPVSITSATIPSISDFRAGRNY